MTDKPRVLSDDRVRQILAYLIECDPKEHAGNWPPEIADVDCSHHRLRQLAMEALDEWEDYSLTYGAHSRYENKQMKYFDERDRIAAIRKELEGENGE